MKPPPFDYEAPRDLDAALGLLAERGGDGKVLAGGQSLVPLLNFRLARPDVLIDVNQLQELSYLRREGGRLRIGALTRQTQVERAPIVRAHWPLLGAALRFVAHPQIRNRGTVGGSVAHADPAAELPVALTALGARYHVRSTRGARTIAHDAMFRGQLETDVAEDELLCEVDVPALPAGAGCAFEEYARRNGDFALGGAAVVLAPDADGGCAHAAIALLGAASTPVRAIAAEAALVGRRVDEPAAREAAAEAVRDIKPTGDIHGTGGYRRDLIETLVRRAVVAAAGRMGDAP
jgi:carbon-monoxide dehydrogenase medium subunit/6-hydroxypseudooxynicotine dehydrogenase subunit alpha